MNKKVFLGVGLIGLVLAVFVYIKAFTSNTQFSEKEKYVFIPTGATYGDVVKILAKEVEDIENFKLVAEKRSYDQNVFPCRFLLKKEWEAFRL
ncbi:hypothetical protein [Flavobacterium davisii]|uniref:hypothetical protein n=1 Tax=Flavobacterium davisii TaxID=2906077 RepID=UPI002869848D|nr:hypothetical protein [Flavobacterium davisii]